MELNLGHGFIPRIGESNYKAVDRCLGPTDLFSSEPLDLPWAIADGAWAEGRPELLDALRTHGTKLLVDTFGWKYRYGPTLDVAKLAATTWAPRTPVNPSDGRSTRDLLVASLRAQAALGSDAYLVPGWMPDDGLEDMRASYANLFEAIATFNDVPAKPYVLFVGGHTRGTERTIALLNEVPHYFEAIYLQLSPISPALDSPSKLEALTSVYSHASRLGFKVVAGHAGAIAPALRALGVDGADAGLATAEAFNRSTARRPRLHPKEDGESRGGRRSRMYFNQIDRSLDASVVEQLLAVPGAAAELRWCRLPCHRFRSDNILEQAREHSLFARVIEAQLVTSLPASMRPTQAYERLRTQRSTLATINSALEASGLPPLDPKVLENRLSWISRTIAVDAAA